MTPPRCGSVTSSTSAGATRCCGSAPTTPSSSPVKIVTISLGTGTDPDALKRIAKATDGLSYQTKTPEQISGVFVDAFLRRSDY